MNETMNQTIAAMKSTLASHISDWEQDGSIPPNYIRRTGLGDEVAKVDRRCGDYQDSHNPVTIGWKATRPTGCGSSLQSDVVVVRDGDTKAAVQEAKRLADEGLVKLYGQRR